MKNRILILLISLGLLLSCNNNDKIVINTELDNINNSIERIILSNYNFIENEYNKFPNKLRHSYEATKLIKSETNKVKNFIIENSELGNEELNDIYKNYVQIVKDSIFIKDINSLKNMMFVENDEYTLLIFEQVINILNIENLITENKISNNKEIVINKLLLGEQLITEYIKDKMYRFDFHLSRMEVIASTESYTIKLGETYRANIFFSASDTSEIFPIFVNSGKSGFQEFSKPEYNIDSIIKTNEPFLLKSNPELFDDTLFYEQGRYAYYCTPKKRGTFRYSGKMILKHPITGELLNYPFICEYKVE